MSEARTVDRAAGLRRFKPYPAYKDPGVESLGEITPHWVVKRLKYACGFNPAASGLAWGLTSPCPEPLDPAAGKKCAGIPRWVHCVRLLGAKMEIRVWRLELAGLNVGEAACTGGK